MGKMLTFLRIALESKQSDFTCVCGRTLARKQKATKKKKKNKWEKEEKSHFTISQFVLQHRLFSLRYGWFFSRCNKQTLSTRILLRFFLALLFQSSKIFKQSKILCDPIYLELFDAFVFLFKLFFYIFFVFFMSSLLFNDSNLRSFFRLQNIFTGFLYLQKLELLHGTFVHAFVFSHCELRLSIIFFMLPVKNFYTNTNNETDISFDARNVFVGFYVVQVVCAV